MAGESARREPPRVYPGERDGEAEWRPSRRALFRLHDIVGREEFRSSQTIVHGERFEPAAYTATQGAARGGQFPSTIYRMLLPNSLGWGDCPKLVRDIRATIDSSNGTPQEPVTYKSPNTFLNSVRQALLNAAEKTEGSLVYNGKLFTLTTEKQVDGALMRLSGTLHETATG
jgi:hypothetical protein